MFLQFLFLIHRLMNYQSAFLYNPQETLRILGVKGMNILLFLNNYNLKHFFRISKSVGGSYEESFLGSRSKSNSEPILDNFSANDRNISMNLNDIWIFYPINVLNSVI